jgi:two-component system, OmpR family, KDP operon response regulator KdpE
LEQPAKILVVEDDFALRRSLRTTLTALGFNISEAGTGEEALLSVRSNECEAVLLDINMPGIGGVETCRRIRRIHPLLPILMLTVRGSEDDKVEALDAGADDYVTKPFQIRELSARLRSAVRRYRVPPASTEMPITIGEITLDPRRHRVEKAGVEIHLTPKEFDVLRYLMEHAGRPVPHTKILSVLWGSEYSKEREYLRVVVSQLRKKLEDNPAQPVYLLTDSYVGYRFNEG